MGGDGVAYWRDVGVKEQAIGGFRGLNESVAPNARPLGVLSAASNLVIDEVPALSTRTGLTVKGATGSGVVNGTYVYRKLDGTEQWLRHVGTVLQQWDGSAWVQVATGLPNTPSTAANLNDVLAIFTGSTAKSWNGAALSNLAGAPQAKYSVEAYQQLFVAGIATREGDLDFCDVSAPTTWTPTATNNAGSIQVSTVPIRWVGFDKVQGKVLIWTTRSLEMLLGPETPNLPDLWEIRTVSQFGTPAGRTVQNLSGTWFWLTSNDEGKGFAVWGGGGIDVQYDSIRTSFDLIDWANVGNACAWTDQKGRYTCSVPKSGGGVLWFIFDPKYGWFTGSGADIRSSSTFAFSGLEKTVVGDVSGYSYTAEGTTDNGTAITWSMELESGLDNAFYNKHLLQMRVLMSAATGATVNISIATSEGGSYETSKTLSPGTSMAPILVPMPVASGGSRRSTLFKVKLNGTGVVTIHDILFRYRTGRS